jgi:thiol-disulfide isomerase/thioredoxin
MRNWGNTTYRPVRLTTAFIAAGALALPAICAAASPPGLAPVAAPVTTSSVTGLWDATVQVGALQVPFKFGIDAGRAKATGWFFNGKEHVSSTDGSFDGTHLVLNFASYAKRLDATLTADGALEGVYTPTTPGSTVHPYTFRAYRAATSKTTTPEKAPDIAGLWIVPAHSEKAGENAWRFIVRQSGVQITAAILRVDGDTGALTGTWENGKVLLSHFDGARPSVIEVSPGADGALHLVVRSRSGADVTLTAYRARQAQSKGLPEAADPALHTKVRDPQQPFQFSFPDLNGHLVSSTDQRFRGKVLLVDIAGSWCPNCHDEAPFLESLYKKYRARGLEVVTLSFEEPEQLANPVRLRAFARQFGLTYTVLLAGTTDELHAKLPQAVGLDAYPTTFFLGRDGRVRAVHAGFAAPATGAFNTDLKRDFTTRIEQLLAERYVTRGQPTAAGL